MNDFGKTVLKSQGPQKYHRCNFFFDNAKKKLEDSIKIYC